MAAAPARSAAGTAAFSWRECAGMGPIAAAAGTYSVVKVVVTPLLSVHLTTVQGRKVVFCDAEITRAFAGRPVLEFNGRRAKPALPAGDDVGVTSVRESVGGASAANGVERVKEEAFDVPTEFVTVTAAVPGNAASTAEMDAVSCVALK